MEFEEIFPGKTADQKAGLKTLMAFAGGKVHGDDGKCYVARDGKFYPEDVNLRLVGTYQRDGDTRRDIVDAADLPADVLESVRSLHLDGFFIYNTQKFTYRTNGNSAGVIKRI